MVELTSPAGHPIMVNPHLVVSVRELAESDPATCIVTPHIGEEFLAAGAAREVAAKLDAHTEN